jgi:electron transport complex protein RnfE
MCFVRELLGSGTVGAGLLGENGAGIRIFPVEYAAMQMIMPVGGFLTLGFLVAGFQWFTKWLHVKKSEKEGAR